VPGEESYDNFIMCTMMAFFIIVGNIGKRVEAVREILFVCKRRRTERKMGLNLGNIILCIYMLCG